MTPEERIQQLQERVRKLENSRSVYKAYMREKEAEIARWKGAYQDLRRSYFVTSPKCATVNHLQRMVNIYEDIISQYQRHYGKWGTFYADWSNTHSDTCKPL